MKGYDAETYGRAIAEDYDRRFADRAAEASAAAAALRRLCGSGPALEIGVGTGHVAEALAAGGCQIAGVDSSEEMLTIARKKAVRNLALCRHDVTAAPFPGDYALVYCVFMTFFMIGDNDAQKRFLRFAADALAPGGRLVLETFVPMESRLGGWTSRVRVGDLTAESVTLVASRIDTEKQVLENQEISFRDGKVELVPAQFYYHTPAQLDEMASAVGLRLAQRWSDWSGGEMTADSPRAISVYEGSSAAHGTSR
ncbi:class I SAM-dependent methyltransferase [Amycolatopsis magusensis]|uniref:SAM-dependent methyltransferase n=1 Tax=Amycolatopsis magusensis TaxID=882444 RepID=A0ABS4PWL9_9PSEU|nr:class I SAM-dependent methyltransferase [Amycolatopsis magusensis]MBP2183828.1 SAM-dependent methyltransferase [Amycolatopsis magusensis]